jgi:hypothetical protein
MLTADLMPALQNPPEPPRRLGPLLRDHLTPIAVLSGWGVLGNGQGLSLVALTSVPPEAARAAVTGVFLTPDGAYLRYGQRDASPGADGPLGPEALVTRLLAVERGEPSTLFVTAEADVPVSDLWSLLRTLPGDRSVALATPLPPGTALPNPGRPSTPAPRCPDGLPPLAEGETPGDLDRHAVIAALPPLHRAGADCMARARGAAATGGTLTLALRVGPDGTVADACLLADDTRDAALGACLLEAARTLQFPAPSPPGPVDLHLPLSLIPTGLTIQRATCAL